MKRIIIIAIMVALCTGCGLKINVKGEWPEGIGSIVSLRDYDNQDQIYAQAEVGQNGKFVIKDNLDYEKRMIVYAGEKKGKAIFVGTSPVTLKISGEGEKATVEVIDPSHDQKVLEDCSTAALGYGLLRLAIPSGINKAMMKATTQAQIDSLKNAYEMTMANTEKMLDDHIDTILTSIAGLYSFENLLLNYRSVDEVQRRYAQLDEKVKKSGLGKKVAEEIEIAATTAVGGTPADFSLPDPDGNQLSLYSLRGQYLILDFWASWCAPCKAEMPNVKEIYAKHQKDGLEILGVSLDDKESKWKNAIKDLDLPWKHVSALQGWDCPAAKYFHVTGIPAMFILDPEGKIIAKDLRGEELANFIDNLFINK